MTAQEKKAGAKAATTPARKKPAERAKKPAAVQTVQVLVVGAGCAGLGAAIRLKQQGINDFVVLEKAGEVGGAWRDNTYPGCTCDIPSNLYSFSFAPKPDWRHVFARQPEIYDYLKDVSQRFGVRPHIRFRVEVLSARWQEQDQHWHLETSAGRYRSRILIGGAGPLHEPKLPDVPGLDDFKGTVFHSAHWNHDHDLRGRRVAVVGTGASAIQFVPEIQPQVGRLVLLQRTAPWVLPKANFETPKLQRELFRRLPLTQRAIRTAIYSGLEAFGYGFRHPEVMQRLGRLALNWLHSQVRDPLLREKLRPDFLLGCKRVLFSNNYYRALAQPNVDVVAGGLKEVRERSVIGADGVEHEVDTLIFGTGFETTDSPIAKKIFDGQGRALESVWNGSPQAYLGTTVSGFPNLFILLGPNVAIGHSSAIFLIEAQLEYVMDALRNMAELDLSSVELRRDVQDAFNDEVQAALRGTVWNAGGCASYYIDRNGRNSGVWPWSTLHFRQRLSRFDLASYHAGREIAAALPEAAVPA
jgi:cation diffusion facilitator CzcD-associated flavoprotein CzcO